MKSSKVNFSKKLYPVSLGCPKNKSDFEKLLYILKNKGYEFTLDPKEAEVFWINTCAFIRPAIEEALEHILELGSLKEKGQKLVVSGCLPARYSLEELKKLLPEVDEFYGIEPFCFFSQEEPLDKLLSESPFYAYLKISEGCSHRCSYCTIPKIRGPFRSKPLPFLLKEAENLLKKGVKELILVGQDTTSYGRDWGERNLLIKLLEALSQLPFFFRIRVLYLHPSHLKEDFIVNFLSIPKVLPYFEIPLQHIHPEILKRMGRNYSPERILKLIEKIRSLNSLTTLRTTFIVGFPGEREEHFEFLLDFLKIAQFDYVGVFPFYPEEGTLAENFPERVSNKEKRRRVAELVRVQREITKARLKARLGKEEEVLLLGEDLRGRLFGLAKSQAPEIDGVTYIKSSASLLPGEIVKVRVIKSGVYDLWGVPLDLRG